MDQSRRDLRPYLVFLLLLAAYLLGYSGQFHSADEESVLAMAESLVKRGWFDTPQRAFAVQIGLPITQETPGTDGRLYSKRGWTWPVLVAPFYGLSLLSSHLGGLQTAHLAAPIVTALTGSLVYLCGRRLGFGPRVSAAGALGFGLGSIALVYAKFLFSEPLIGLTLTGSVWALLRYRQRRSLQMAALAGALLGLAGATRLSTLALSPVLGLYLLWASVSPSDLPSSPREGVRLGWRRALGALVALGLGCAIPVAVTGAYNWARFGSLWQGGYTSEAEGFTTAPWRGMYGLLLSPGKGFFWYSPLLLLALPGSVMMWHQRKAEVLLIWGLFLGTALTYAAWYMWWGGSVWGPRFLVPVAAPLALLTLPVLERARGRALAVIAVGALLVLSVGVQLLGTAVNFLDYGASLVALDPRAEWTIAVHDIRHQPIWGHLRFLQPAHLDLAWVRSTGDRYVVDGWMLGSGLLLLIACTAVWLAYERRGRLRAALPLLTLACLGVAVLGQVRIYDALLALPEVRPWKELYDGLAAEARPGDVLFMQDTLGGQLGYALDQSRAARYQWSPRPIPLDEESAGWVGRYAQPRVWLASGVPAALDQSRGIERWLAEWGARLVEVEFEGGPRLVCFERTPDSLRERIADLSFGHQVRLLRYASTEGQVSPGTSLHLVMAWQAEVRPSFDYSVFVHLLGPDRRIYRQVDGAPMSGMRPMGTWFEGEVIVDRYGFLLPDDCPAGAYRLAVGVYRWDTLERLPIVESDGRAMGDALDVAAITVP